MVTTEAVLEQLANIRQEREEFIKQVERQAAAYDGAIQALEHLLSSVTEEGNNALDS